MQIVFATGMNVTDVLGLVWSDFYHEKDKYYIRTNKVMERMYEKELQFLPKDYVIQKYVHDKKIKLKTQVVHHYVDKENIYSIPCALYELKVDDETYEKAKNHVDDMMENADCYRYNVLGLILCRMNIAYDRKRRYFCSEFLSEVLEKSNAIEHPKHPSLMRPADYTNIDGINCLFDGKLHELKSSIRPGYQYC